MVDKEELGEAVAVDKVEVLQPEEDIKEDLRQTVAGVPEVELLVAAGMDPMVDLPLPSTTDMLRQEVDLLVDPMEDLPPQLTTNMHHQAVDHLAVDPLLVAGMVLLDLDQVDLATTSVGTRDLRENSKRRF